MYHYLACSSSIQKEYQKEYLPPVLMRKHNYFMNMKLYKWDAHSPKHKIVMNFHESVLNNSHKIHYSAIIYSSISQGFHIQKLQFIVAFFKLKKYILIYWLSYLSRFKSLIFTVLYKIGEILVLNTLSNV